MKGFLLFATGLALVACSDIEKIATNTGRTNEILQSSTPSPNPNPSPNPPGSTIVGVDLLGPRISYADLYSNIVEFDTTIAVTDDWFRFIVRVKPVGNPNLIKEYKGHLHASQPDQLYIDSITTETLPEMVTINETEFQKTKKRELEQYVANPKRSLKLSNDEWHKVLISGKGTFNGFDIANRNLNFVNFSNFSFNYSRLSADTLYKVYGISADRLELPSNTFIETEFFNSLLSNVRLTNWHFVAEDLVTKDYWYRSKLFTSDLNDCVFRNIGIREGEWNNVVVRHQNYGVFEKVQFSNMLMNSVWFEKANFLQTAFQGVTMTGQILNSDFVGVKFRKGTNNVNTTFNGMSNIGGRFTNCTFEEGTKFNASTLQNAECQGGSYTGIIFENNSAIRNSTFKEITFMGCNFGNSTFNDVQFGTTASTYPMLIANCNFTNVVWQPNVRFVRCNFNNCTFPPRSVLNQMGVYFSPDCTGVPQ